MAILTDENGRRNTVLTPDEVDRNASAVLDKLSLTELGVLNRLFQAGFIGEDVAEGAMTRVTDRLYKRRPVTMEQFIDDPYYLGASTTTLYPALREDLIALFDHPYREVIFTGALGVGKTFAASIAMCRILYELSCLIDPQEAMGMSPGSEMVLAVISRNLILAREIMKTAVDDKLKISPYFMEHFRPRFRKDNTMFPNNIRLIVGSYGSERILGGNLLGVSLDETNFPPKRKGQHITTGIGQKKTAAHFDIVEKTYLGLVRRIKSRFQHAGGSVSGMVMLASSANTLDSFTERKIRDCMDDPTVFVRDHTPWTVKPQDHFCGEHFYVLCSSSSLKARILEESEYDKITDEWLEEHDSYIIDIPVEYRDDFESNMEDALRDIAGVPTQAVSAFIQRLDAVDQCLDDREHVFSTTEWVAGPRGGWRWPLMTRPFERQLPGGHTEQAHAPIVNPKAPRWVHVDTSLSGDATGFCVAHVDYWVEVVRRNEYGDQYPEMVPHYFVDALLRIVPPPAEQIYLPDVRRLIYDLQEHGYYFAGFSSDSYMYAEMHQQIRRRGITPALISMDKTTAPYDELKSALYEDRMKMYRYEPLLEELRNLVYDRERGKVDHPEHHAKDVSDALAGCLYGLMANAHRLPSGYGDGSGRRSVSHRHAWVTDLVPADQVTPEDIEAARDDDGPDEFAPILFGSDDDY